MSKEASSRNWRLSDLSFGVRRMGVAFLATHFRTVARAEDDERLYYALDATVELVLADLVRGADPTAASYTAPSVVLNEVSTTTVAVSTPSTAGPAATQQYFDPGVTNPELLTIPSGEGYLLHMLSVYPSQGTTTSPRFDSF